MAIRTMELPPVFLDNTEFHADPVRRLLSSLFNDKVGIFGDDVLETEVNPADFTLTVSPGKAALPPPDENSTGVFLVENATPATLPIEPPHATQDRRDLLIAYVVPSPDATTGGTWRLEVRTGTPSATPVAPVVPNTLVLDEISVPSEARAEVPSRLNRRRSNGQLYLGGVILSSPDRPDGSSVRVGTVWIDWDNGNTWVWEGYRWYAAGVPRFPSTTTRNAAFDNPIEGQLAVTYSPPTLWAYTGSSRGWLPVGDTERASHAITGTVAANGTGSTASNLAFKTGRNGGVATITSGTTVRLNRAGRWGITLMTYSDGGATGLSKVQIMWTNGAFTQPDLTTSTTRGSGFGGAGQLNQTLAWTGNVTAAQAAAPLDVRALFASVGNGAIDYSIYLSLEYLGQ